MSLQSDLMHGKSLESPLSVRVLLSPSTLSCISSQKHKKNLSLYFKLLWAFYLCTLHVNQAKKQFVKKRSKHSNILTSLLSKTFFVELFCLNRGLYRRWLKTSFYRLKENSNFTEMFMKRYFHNILTWWKISNLRSQSKFVWKCSEKIAVDMNVTM